MLCGRVGGSYCNGAQQAIAKIRTGPAPSWLVTGLLSLGAVGLTVVNALQGGLDPATDGLEVADIGALTSDVAEGAASDDAEAAAAECGGESFTGGTKVLLASGAAVPISSLKRGDKVLATNTRTGKTTVKRVKAVLVHYDTNRYNLIVKTAHGTAVLHTTRGHVFWDPAAHRWVKAASLRYGTHLRASGDRAAVVIGGRRPANRAGWMWDLTVATDHDFYVAAGTSAVLAHNCPSDAYWERHAAWPAIRRARMLSSKSPPDTQAHKSMSRSTHLRAPGSWTCSPTMGRR